MSLHPEQRKVIPNRLKYLNPTLTDYVGRTTTKIIPNNAGTFNANSQITIELPQSTSNFADFQNSYLSMNVQLTNAVADKVSFDDSSASFIKRLTLKSSAGNVLEDIVNYNELCAVSELLTSSQGYTGSVGQILDGTSSKFATAGGTPNTYSAGGADRIALAKAGGRRCIKLISGILQSTQLFPMNKGLIIEIYLTTAEEAGGGTDAVGASTLTVTDVAFILDSVQVSPEYQIAYDQQYKSGGIKFWCPTWLSSVNTVSGENYTTTISENMKFIKHVWFYCRSQAKNNVATLRQTEFFEGKDLEYFQFRHGIRYTPQQKVDCRGTRAEAMAELLKSVNVAGSVKEDLPFTLGNYSDNVTYGAGGASTMAIFGINFELDPHENMSGINSNKQPLSLSLNFATAPATTNLYTLVNYDQIITITPEGCLVSY